jgi:thymidylate synthase ThyX
LEHGTQKEHYQVAETIWEAIAPEIPSIVSYMESRDTK